MLISDGYRNLNAALHDTHRYGARGDKWADKVRDLAETHAIKSLLDYGCGKGALKKAIAGHRDLDIREYDPAIPDKSAAPGPADMVVCTDVLEHVEPDCIADVVAHLKQLTQRVLFLVVSTRPAAKFLADGRNAHLIVQPLEYWQDLLTRDMTIAETRVMSDEFALTLLRPPPVRP